MLILNLSTLPSILKYTTVMLSQHKNKVLVTLYSILNILISGNNTQDQKFTSLKIHSVNSLHFSEHLFYKKSKKHVLSTSLYFSLGFLVADILIQDTVSIKIDNCSFFGRTNFCLKFRIRDRI